jgi:hypothetical protein
VGTTDRYEGRLATAVTPPVLNVVKVKSAVSVVPARPSIDAIVATTLMLTVTPVCSITSDGSAASAAPSTLAL